MTFTQKILTLLVVTLAFSSCYKDEVISTESVDVVGAERVYLNTIIGQVLDTIGAPVPSALIEVEDQTTMTDSEGRFTIVDVMIPSSGAFVSATHLDYYEGGTRVYATAPITQTIQINLVPKGISSNFSNSQGATLEVDNLAKVIIPQDAFIKDNVTYQGMVTLEVYLVNPNSAESFDKRIQVFESYNKNSESKIQKSDLASIMYIEAYDDEGKTLNIDPNRKVRVSLPSYGTSNSIAELYSFNEEIGFWILENEAEINGDFFEVELDHFSWWGIGSSQIATDLCITFITEIPENGHYFTISNPKGRVIQSGAVNYNEEICFLAPMDEELEVRVFSECFLPIFGTAIFSSPGEPNLTIEVLRDGTQGYLIEIEVVDCDITHFQDSVTVYYSTELSIDSLGRGIGTFDLSLDECFLPQTVSIIVQQDLGNTTYTFTEQVDIVPGQSQYNIQVVACQDVMPEEGQLTINGITFFNVVGRKNPQETLIIASEGDEEVIIGFDGFEEGTFPGRVVSFGTNVFCEGKVTVDFYGEVGDYIRGTFSIPEDASLACEPIEGEFIAFREK